MNESPVFDGIVIPFSEHQGQSRFGVTNTELCFEHDNLRCLGDIQGAIWKQLDLKV